MALYWGSTQIPTSATIKYNGNTVKKVYWNSVLIWQADIKYISCPDCDGKGWTSECSYCDSGECHYCNGSGYSKVRCANCHLVDSGESWSYCHYCNGKGYNWACNVCGAVYSRESNLPTGAYCGSCEARTGMQYSDWTELMCEQCGGNGVLNPDLWGTCSTCNGTGYIQGNKCSYCDGNGGPCSYCGGNHYYNCTTCLGYGQIEEPEETISGIYWTEEDTSAIIRLANGIEIAWEIDSSGINHFSSDNCHLQVCSKSDGETYHWGHNSVYAEFFQGRSGNVIYFVNHDCYNDQYYNTYCYGNTYMEMEYLVKDSPDWVVAKITYNTGGTYTLDDSTA